MRETLIGIEKRLFSLVLYTAFFFFFSFPFCVYLSHTTNSWGDTHTDRSLYPGEEKIGFS